MGSAENRICPECNGEMAAERDRPTAMSPFIWSERYLDYGCTVCGHRARIILAGSILFNLFTCLFGLGILAWGLANLQSLKYMLASGPMGIALGSASGLLVLVMAAGGMVAGISGLRAFQQNRRSPLVSPAKGAGRLFLTLLVSALPVALAVAVGVFDHYVHDLDQDLAIFILPVIFSPLLLGARFGLNFLGLFLGCGMWMGLLVAIIMLR